MTHRYTIGGIAFLVDEILPGLETTTFVDATLRVRFVDEAPIVEPDNPGMRRVDGPMDLTGAIDPDTRECTLPILSPDPIDRSWQLRQMAPIFSATLGRLVLHAGAVEIGDCVVAFVGASGAGKSTLARFLTDRGHRFVADDLLPIRFAPEASAPMDAHLLPLAMVAFLQRTATDTVIAERVTAVDALQNLILHGFGEHGDPGSWGFQFDAYHRLAESTPIVDLTIPDDLDALPLVERALTDFSDEVPSPGPVS